MIASQRGAHDGRMLGRVHGGRRLVVVLAWGMGVPWACTDGSGADVRARPVPAEPEAPRNSDGSLQVLPPGPPTRPPHTLVLAYDDFGPQALAHTLLGSQWWQWEGGGSWERDDRFDIRVVVYRGLSAEEVAAEYRTVEGQADYRYVSYEEAMAFFEHALADTEREPSLQGLREGLVKTRARVQRALGVRSDR